MFTNDLDFSAMLAHLQTDGPSVFQLRTHDLLPESQAERVVAALEEHQNELNAGAVVTIDDLNVRVRILPLGRSL